MDVQAFELGFDIWILGPFCLVGDGLVVEYQASWSH